ncbi:hypothetical protein V1507DRAFT_498630 [Lipomyces tetrasporus]
MGYKKLYLEAEKQLKIVEDEIKQAEYLRKLAEDERNQAEERFLQPPDEAPSRLLSSSGCLQYLGESVCRQQLASEADLATYERSAVQNQVYDAIIATLCFIPAAQETFHLGAEIRFDNSSNAIYIAENGDRILLYTVEYKPAHKLSAEYLRSGLREMNFGLKFNADQLTRAAVAQVYDGMIRDVLAYACLTNGYCTVFFHVHEDNPETLYYFLSEPKMDVE